MSFQLFNSSLQVSEPVTLTIEDVEEFLHKDYQEFPCQVPGKEYQDLFSLLTGKGFRIHFLD